MATTSSNSDLQIVLQQLSAAVGSNNESRAPKILGHRKLSSPSLKEPLLRSSSLARNLIRHLFPSRSQEHDVLANPRVNFRAEFVIRSLLLSPSMYETPWETACELIVYLQSARHNWDGSEMRTCMADVQSFLQQTVAFWLEEERRRLILCIEEPSDIRLVEGEAWSTNTPHTWIHRIIETLSSPMHSVAEASQVTEHWIVTLELLPLIVSLSQDLDSSFWNSCLDLMFQKPVQSDYLSHWLNLASELSSQLRDQDIRFLQVAVRQALTGKAFEVSQECILSFVQPIYLLSVRCLSRDDTEVLRRWHELILCTMTVVARGQHAYSTLESILLTSLSELSSASLYHWTRGIPSDPNDVPGVPPWIHCNLLLLVLRCSRLSGSEFVSRLVARAFGSPGSSQDVSNLNDLCWTKIVKCIGNPYSVSAQVFMPTHDSMYLQRLFGSITYEACGNFLNNQRAQIEFLSNAGYVIYKSLFPTCTLMSCTTTPNSADRGIDWIHAIISRIENQSANESSWDLALAVVTVAIVFAELPSARTFVERTFVESLLSDNESNAIRVSISQVFSIAISLAASNPTTSEALLDSLTDFNRLVGGLVDSRLPLAILYSLLDTLRLHPLARRCMLKAAKSSLQVVSSKCFRRGTIGRITYFTDPRNHQRIGLHCLLSMTSVEHWHDFELDAWALLFDVLVSNRCIPCECRTWLYKRMDHQVRGGLVHKKAAIHFFRALVLRLLDFFGASESGNDAFLPGLLLFSRSMDSGKKFEAVEDLCGLVRCILSLASYCADEESQATLTRWRLLLLQLVQSPLLIDSPCEDISSSSVWMEFTDVGLGAAVPTQGAMICLYLILCFTNDEIPAHVLAQGTLSVEALRRAIYLQEETYLTDAHLPSLRQSTTSKRDVTYDLAEVRELCFSLLTPIILFMVDNDSSIQSQLAIAERTPREAESLIVGLSQLVASLGESSYINTRLVFKVDDSTTFFSLFGTFVALAIPVIESLLKNRENFEKLESVLAMTLQLIDSLAETNKTGRGNEELQSYKLLETVRRVHLAISGEQATLKLIEYLEDAAFYFTGPTKIGKISSCSDIDCTVQMIRFRVLRSLHASLAASTTPVKETLIPTYCEKKCVGQNKRAALGMQLLDELSVDLIQGILGRSGGLSNDLFTVYLDCIAACAHLLCQLISATESTVSFLRCVATTAARAGDRLDLVLCTVSLKCSATLRKCMNLVCHKLPSLVRLAIQAIAPSTEDYELEPSEVASRANLRYLDQAKGILDRKIDYALTNSVADWKTIAGIEHLNEIQESGSPRKQVAESPSSDSEEGTSIFSSSSVSFRKRSENRHIQLYSERVWCWALCSMFLAVDDDLAETARLLTDGVSFFRSARNRELYLRNRTVQISALSSAVGEFFELTEKESSQTHHQVDIPECMRAVSLPSAVKLRLVSAQERALIVLLKSFTVVTKFIRSPYQTQIDYPVSLVEAVAFITCWLVSDSKSDPCSAISSWIVAERSMARQKEPESDSFLLKLQRAGIRVEQLEGSLRRFNDALHEVQKSKSLCEFRMISSVTQLMNLSEIRRDDELELVHLVSKKARTLEAIRLSEPNEAGTNKRRAEPGPRDKRKRHIRSRNEVIDKWLQQDQSIGHDEALEEDAYADLEDFIDGFG